MSRALFERAARGRHVALSAGTTPADQIHPQVVDVMREVGIDLSNSRPQRLTRKLIEQAELVVTMGCCDSCPYIPGKRYVDWDLPDPSEMPVDQVRRLREEIAERVRTLAAAL